MWNREDYKYGFKYESIRKDKETLELAKQYYVGDDFERELLRGLHPDHCDTTFADVDTYEYIEEEIERNTKLRDELRFEKTQTGRPVARLHLTEETLGQHFKDLEHLRKQYGLLQKPREKSQVLSKEDLPWLNR